MTTALLALTLLGLTVLIVLQLRPKKEQGIDPSELIRLRGELDRKTEELGQVKKQGENDRKEKDELAGKGKEQFVRCTKLEAELKSVRDDRDHLKDRIAKLEESDERRVRESQEQLQKLSRAEKSFEDEKMRVRREDEERQQQMIAERDRLWNEHEQKVIHALKELCAQSEYAFTSFENTNLPDGFDGSLKPDFMISFLNQYVVFDAKVSRSENFQNYIATNAKKTASKYKGMKEIYPTIFFVVPMEAIAELTKRVFTENGFTFYVVSPEALAPILAALKKITTYEFAEHMDPEERESIIRLLAKLDNHINVRNTFDVILAKMGAELLADSKKLYPELSREVEQEKQKIRIPSFKTSDIKRLVASSDEREKEVDDLTAPRAAIGV